MRITRAEVGDVPELARLLWLDHFEGSPSRGPLDAFAAELGGWWADHQDSHTAYVARVGPELVGPLVGMAWVALVPRVPRPGTTSRTSADIQSVFVVPEHRGHGIGSALVEAATHHATRLGAMHVTVHSGRRAVPMYERLGFSSSPELLQR